jgi:phenylalanyl-tRNA synthetase beta chain
MKISYNWLSQFIELEKSAAEIGNILTSTGLEVEAIEDFSEIKGNLDGFVIGEVLTCDSHPNADKLSLTTVDIGGGVIAPIVCGAKNVAKGQKVVVATIGATIHPPEGESFQIKKAKIRGEASEGMICAEDELGIGTSHDGILVLETILANGTPAVEYFKPEIDKVFEIGLTPNRADAASHLGVARDIKAVTGVDLKTIKTKITYPNQPTNEIKISVKNSEACPRYTGLVIEGLKVQDSPKWLQNRLESIGLNPINNVVDITNYVLHSVGQPLHAFDLAAIKGNNIQVKQAGEQEEFTTLDGKVRKLSKTDLMICNESESMCIAGVFGGLHSGVSDETTGIFLESAYFSADWIRKTAMKHQLKTDASFRFERGTDPNNTILAVEMAAELILELCGGTITSRLIDVYPAPINDAQIEIKFKNINRLIGQILPKEQILDILSKLDIKANQVTEDGFTATVPPYRVDVTRESDVIEEILRIFGYDNIPLSSQLGSDFISNFPKIDKQAQKNKVANYLVGNGFFEIFTNSLTSPAYTKNSDLWKESENVVIINKLSEDLEVMRRSLLFSGLEAIRYNISHRQFDIKFFEIGKTYSKSDNGYNETEHLALFMAGSATPEHWFESKSQVAFYHLSTKVYGLLESFGIREYDIVQVQREDFGNALMVNVGTDTIVTFGTVSNTILKSMQIKNEILYADFDWKALSKYGKSKITFKEVPKFPEVRRDLSLVLDKKITFNEVKRVALLTEKRFIKSLNVFSVYEGDKIEAGKKAYAISFILQDENKTLEDKGIDRIMQQLMQSFEKQLDAKIRK